MSRLKRIVAAVLGTSLLVPLVPSAAQAKARMDEPVVKVHVLKVNGSGCPTDSSVVTGVPDALQDAARVRQEDLARA